MPRLTRLAALLVSVVLIGACGDDKSTSESGQTLGPSSSLEISTTPDASMWDDGTATCPVTGLAASAANDAKPAKEGIEGVMAFPDKHGHAEGCIQYTVSPPVVGVHNPIPATCGFYASAVPNEHAVHSLEHGAAWIAYGSDVDVTTLDTIRAAAAATSHVLASPYPGLGSKIVMTAWARQLTLDSVTDPRFQQFLDKYVQGPNTPELGASCLGMGSPG